MNIKKIIFLIAVIGLVIEGRANASTPICTLPSSLLVMSDKVYCDFQDAIRVVRSGNEEYKGSRTGKLFQLTPVVGTPGFQFKFLYLNDWSLSEKDAAIESARLGTEGGYVDVNGHLLGSNKSWSAPHDVLIRSGVRFAQGTLAYSIRVGYVGQKIKSKYIE